MSCGSCKTKLNSRSQSVSCDGYCNEQFHVSCSNIPPDVLKYLGKVSGLKWLCGKCCVTSESCDPKYIREFVEKNTNSMMKEIENSFLQLKNDISQLASSKLEEMCGTIQMNMEQMPKSSVPDTTSVAASKTNNLYSTALKSKAAVIIKPKENTQKNYQTKVDILQEINPKTEMINIKSVKNINHGGVVIGCSSNSEATKLKSLANSKLSEKYEIRNVKSLNPRIRVVGMSEKLDENSLCDLLRYQNNSLFTETSELKVLNIWPTKKNKNVFQAVLQVDVSLYNNIMSVGNSKLFIGFDYCEVYDHITVRRCFKCCGYNHISSTCKQQSCCPRCAENHLVQECKASENELKCGNCIKLKERTNNINITVNHAVWDPNCYVYNKSVAEFKSNMYMA